MNFRTREEKYYGSLVLNMKLPENSGAYILQLLNEREAVIEERLLTASTKVNYTYLQPGRYRMKIIKDINGDGKWSTGNFLKNIQPEEVLYNSESVMIRSNWDAELDWQIK